MLPSFFFLILNYIDQTEYVLKFEVGFLVFVILHVLRPISFKTFQRGTLS